MSIRLALLGSYPNLQLDYSPIPTTARIHTIGSPAGRISMHMILAVVVAAAFVGFDVQPAKA
jgi:hypothetical protein